MDVKFGLVVLWLVIPSVLSFPKRNKRIVNGQTILRGAWPFLVSLHYKKDDPYTRNSKMKHLCGGTLIHPRWVLTAAHCIGLSDEHSNPENWDVVVGEYNQFVEDDGEQVIEPEEFFVHPGFTFRQTKILANDIGLIKLKEEVVVGPYAIPISIDKRENIELNSECKIGGWGQVSLDPYGWGMYIPLETSLYISDIDECKAMYDPTNSSGKFRVYIDESWLCAGIPLQNQSTIEKMYDGVSGVCLGDSGGPLICKNDKTGEDVVSGIVALSKGCGVSLFSDGFTRVSYFQDWIQEVILLYTPEDEPSLTEMWAYLFEI